MLIRKRNGEEVLFDKERIETAILKANKSVDADEQLETEYAAAIASRIENKCKTLGQIPTVEEVQDMVVTEIMKAGKYRLANNYIT